MLIIDRTHTGTQGKPTAIPIQTHRKQMSLGVDTNCSSHSMVTNTADSSLQITHPTTHA